MVDRNADLALAFNAFKVALIAHLTGQPDMLVDVDEVEIAVNRILTKAAIALADESFSLDEGHILDGLLHGFE